MMEGYQVVMRGSGAAQRSALPGGKYILKVNVTLWVGFQKQYNRYNFFLSIVYAFLYMSFYHFLRPEFGWYTTNYHLKCYLKIKLSLNDFI